MGGAPGLGDMRDHFLRPDDPEVRRGEIVEAHLDLEAVVPHREESLERLHRSGCGEFREPGPHRLIATRRERRGAGHDAEQGGEVQIHRGDAGQPVRPVLRVGAAHEGEVGNGDVDLLHLPGPDIELDVGALRAGGQGPKEREARQDQSQEGGSGRQRSPQIVRSCHPCLSSKLNSTRRAGLFQSAGRGGNGLASEMARKAARS